MRHSFSSSLCALFYCQLLGIGKFLDSALNPLFSIGQVAVAVAPLVCLIAYYLFIESKSVVKCFQWMWTKIKAITARKQNSEIVESDSYNMMIDSMQ